MFRKNTQRVAASLHRIVGIVDNVIYVTADQIIANPINFAPCCFSCRLTDTDNSFVRVYFYNTGTGMTEMGN